MIEKLKTTASRRISGQASLLWQRQRPGLTTHQPLKLLPDSDRDKQMIFRTDCHCQIRPSSIPQNRCLPEMRLFAVAFNFSTILITWFFILLLYVAYQMNQNVLAIKKRDWTLNTRENMEVKASWSKKRWDKMFIHYFMVSHLFYNRYSLSVINLRRNGSGTRW